MQDHTHITGSAQCSCSGHAKCHRCQTILGSDQRCAGILRSFHLSELLALLLTGEQQAFALNTKLTADKAFGQHKLSRHHRRIQLSVAAQGRHTGSSGAGLLIGDCKQAAQLSVNSNTRRLGDIGKKIHSGRSRNDQVLVDLRLFIRSKIEEVVECVTRLFDTLQRQSERYKEVLMPGYTHLQVAMPSSFGLWFGAYAESLADDLMVLLAAYRVNDRNPLGSAAGYGSSFPLNRTMTTELLGFASLDYNVVYAQMGRGKTERIVANAIAGIAATVSKLAFDACMFSSQNFGFVKLDDRFTTGSSIMPHKKNPDVFELTRAKCNKIQSLPAQITLITNNLPSGYFRDLQIIKEAFLPMFDEMKSILAMTEEMIAHISVNEHILDDDRYRFMFSVEEVNRLTAAGMPFRDAYKKVGLDIEAGNFTPCKEVKHTHEGSIGNLCTERIASLYRDTLAQFDFEHYHKAFENLLK